MASISLLVLGFIALLGGFAYFYNKLKRVTGSVVVLVIGLVALYITVTLSDLFLSYAGFETGFPDTTTGYYFYQAFIYIGLGIVMLGSHYFLLRETQSKEVSHAFWWCGLVLLVSGGLDLLVEAFIRLPLMEIRLFIAIVVLVVLIFIASKYRNLLFGKKETPEKK
jgi:hypothetical protein